MSTLTHVGSDATAARLDLSGKSSGRALKDRLARVLVWSAFVVACIPLVWILASTVIKGGHMLLSADWWTLSQNGITSRRVGGGAAHAIQGTLMQALVTAAMSVPIGVLTAIYLVEYGRGRLAKVVSFMVDILTGVPSIVAALFIYALWVTTFGFQRVPFAVTLALTLLMIPTIVRSTEEMLKLVPNELREASYALGVPKWLTIVRIVIPTAISGLVSGIILAIARVIGETAPLLIAAGFTASLNNDPFSGPMMTLPVFVYDSYAHPGVDVQAYWDRAWTGALTLILIVMLLNLIGRLIARRFAPKTGR